MEKLVLKNLLNCPENKKLVDKLKKEGKIQEWYSLDMISKTIEEYRFGTSPSPAAPSEQAT